MESIDESQSPRLTQSATWTLSGSSWWIKVEVERHLRDDVARALEADLHALGFVLSMAALSGEALVREASGDAWSARFCTVGSLGEDLVHVANARLDRFVDVLDVRDVETLA